MDPSAADPVQLSQVIAHATAPSFLLGAVSGFVAVLMGRMNGIIDRIRNLNAIADDDAARAPLKLDLPRLKARAKLVNMAIFLASPAGDYITGATMVVDGGEWLKKGME